MPALVLHLDEYRILCEGPTTLFRAVRATRAALGRGHRPSWARAHVDHGGTRLYGPGPYLVVPWTGDRDAGAARLRPVAPPGGTASLWLFGPTGLRPLGQRVTVRTVRVRRDSSRRGAPWTWELDLVLETAG